DRPPRIPTRSACLRGAWPQAFHLQRPAPYGRSWAVFRLFFQGCEWRYEREHETRGGIVKSCLGIQFHSQSPLDELRSEAFSGRWGHCWPVALTPLKSQGRLRVPFNGPLYFDAPAIRAQRAI